MRRIYRSGGIESDVGVAAESDLVNGAEGGTRTPTGLLQQAPEACASANSATSACHVAPGGIATSTRTVNYTSAVQKFTHLRAIAPLRGSTAISGHRRHSPQCQSNTNSTVTNVSFAPR